MPMSTLVGQITRHDIVRALLGAVLLFAAIAKWHTLATDGIRADHWWETRPFLATLAVAEFGFGLWLLCGMYPRPTWAAALAVFGVFGMFAGYLFVKGAPSCPCFAELHSSPSISALFNGIAVMTLAHSPPTNPRQLDFATAPWRLYLFGLTFGIFAVPGVLDMVYYSHQGVALDLRSDLRLHVPIAKRASRPSSDDLLVVLHKSTGLELALEESLRADPPDYGIWNMGKAWSVMLGMAEKQNTPARWDKIVDGYRLTRASPLGRNRLVPWIASATIVFVVSIAIIFFLWRYGTAALLQRVGGVAQ